MLLPHADTKNNTRWVGVMACIGDFIIIIYSSVSLRGMFWPVFTEHCLTLLLLLFSPNPIFSLDVAAYLSTLSTVSIPQAPLFSLDVSTYLSTVPYRGRYWFYGTIPYGMKTKIGFSTLGVTSSAKKYLAVIHGFKIKQDEPFAQVTCDLSIQGYAHSGIRWLSVAEKSVIRWENLQ